MIFLAIFLDRFNPEKKHIHCKSFVLRKYKMQLLLDKYQVTRKRSKLNYNLIVFYLFLLMAQCSS